MCFTSRRDLMKYLLSILLILFLLILPGLSLARTTPQDTIDEAQNSYNQRVKSYSVVHQKQLDQFSKDVTALNKQETDYLENIVLKQGEILDEYVKRNNINENGGEDGVHRSNDPVSTTRIAITRVHEAIAYQAAHAYILNLTSESNIKNAANNAVANLQSDLSRVRESTIYSQSLLQNLVKDK